MKRVKGEKRNLSSDNELVRDKRRERERKRERFGKHRHGTRW